MPGGGLPCFTQPGATTGKIGFGSFQLHAAGLEERSRPQGGGLEAGLSSNMECGQMVSLEERFIILGPFGESVS